MEYVHQALKYEIDFMIFIQNLFHCSCMIYEKTFFYLCKIFDSRILYTILIPIFAAFSIRLYRKLFLTCLVTDLATIVLKWIIAEKRPSWWYYENVSSQSSNPFLLYQTEISCEASPSSPSRHLALAASFLFVLLNEVSETVGRNKSRSCQFLLKYSLSIIYSLLTILLMISRMYFSISLLHQCILGVFVGIFIAKKLQTTKILDKLLKYSKVAWINIEFLVILTSLGFYWGHKIFGDPNWAVKSAFKHCKDPYYLDPDTTLIFGIVRCTGLIFGVFLSAPLNKTRAYKLKYYFSIPMTAFYIALQCYGVYNTPRQFKYLIYYLYTFAIHALGPTFFLYFTPLICFGKVDKLKSK